MQKPNISKLAEKIVGPLMIVGFGAMLRLLPHPANIAPIGAMALFGGVYFDKKYALVIPLLALFVSDIFLGFHGTMIFVYGCFLITGLIGVYIKHHKSVQYILFGSILSSLIFYVVTNFGVWLVSDLYAKTAFGLFQSYSMALPFFRNTLIGDLFYTGIFFGSYEMVLRTVRNNTFSKNI